MADFNNTNLADFSGVWVFCEQRQGKLQPTVLELISEARKLADDMGTEVCGLLIHIILYNHNFGRLHNLWNQVHQHL